jgi:hypothetical protein
MVHLTRHYRKPLLLQQSLVLWRTNNPWNIFISIVSTPAADFKAAYQQWRKSF